MYKGGAGKCCCERKIGVCMCRDTREVYDILKSMIEEGIENIDVQKLETGIAGAGHVQILLVCILCTRRPLSDHRY